MVRMQDIAEKAGVSTATVSLIINNRARASAKTIEAVERAMKELNYSPKSRRTRTARPQKPSDSRWSVHESEQPDGRGPQSVQSVPEGQLAYSLPGPPSLQ